MLGDDGIVKNFGFGLSLSLLGLLLFTLWLRRISEEESLGLSEVAGVAIQHVTTVLAYVGFEFLHHDPGDSGGVEARFGVGRRAFLAALGCGLLQLGPLLPQLLTELILGLFGLLNHVLYLEEGHVVVLSQHLPAEGLARRRRAGYQHFDGPKVSPLEELGGDFLYVGNHPALAPPVEVLCLEQVRWLQAEVEGEQIGVLCQHGLLGRYRRHLVGRGDVVDDALYQGCLCLVREIYCQQIMLLLLPRREPFDEPGAVPDMYGGDVVVPRTDCSMRLLTQPARLECVVECLFPVAVEDARGHHVALEVLLGVEGQ
mmetsp:Transcript_51347/g.128941  ORF Transcript_51347/g.128941 Transcript_51347/m.128941 type:complete len:314 (-) Transcript_51347:607-1548(-)